MANRVCPTCGEEYSDTYKRCPFCEEAEVLEKGRNLHRGGKRSVKRQRGNGGALGVMLLLSAVIILGVLAYVFFGDEIASFMGIRTEGDDSSYVPPVSDNAGNGQTDDTTTPDGGGQTNPPADPTPLTLESPAAFTIGAGETGRITVTGGTGEISWTSSNPEIAAVADGAVTGVAGGTATITATSGEESVSCTVKVTGDPWVSGASLKLNKTDITINDTYPNPVTLKIEGGEYTSASWSSDNTNVATVSGSGQVSRVGKGTANITCVVDGQTLTCIVRCG